MAPVVTPDPDSPEAREEARTHGDTLGAQGVATLPSQTPVPRSERYELQELLGSGGMGRVYKALDRKLTRPVALKFLRGADAQLERRFLQEAQAQARIDHPGVCKVYEVGRIGEEPYIAMQYIEGKTLRDAARELSVREKVQIMRDVAAAMQAAHKLGLVHRDLKPANILLERGERGALHPFITDFGLARDLAAPGNTVAGALMGTPQYMAPEQARGEHDRIDARTDVYGLGATLYDVLTGQPPFQGSSNLQTLYKMLNEEPPPAQKLAPALPADLSSIVMKCLEKDPARRYPSARALADELQRSLDGEPVQARPASASYRLWRAARRNRAVLVALGLVLAALLLPRVPMLFDRGEHIVVAVADFDNQTHEEGLDGLSGMLITSLEQSNRLSVVTRSRMFDLLRETGHPEAQRIDETLGRELSQKAGARALVLASIRKFDKLYVLDVKVLDLRTNEYLVALKEEATGASEVPRMIDRLSAQARGALREKAEQGRPIAEVTTTNLEAYQRYFEGEQLVDHLRFSDAAAHLRKAVAIDPQFALGWYRLGYSLMWLHDGPKAREAIDRAIALQERLPEKERLVAQGVRASLAGRGEEAYGAYKACAERFPTEKECVFDLGDVIFHGGYFAPAVDLFEKALQLDPTMERAHEHLVWAYQLLGKKDEMVAAAERNVAKVGNAEAYGHLARAQAARGELARSRATLARAQQLFPLSALPLADLAALDAWQWEIDGAVAKARKLVASPGARDRLLGGLVLGGALVQGGRAREAVSAYEKAASDAQAAGELELEAFALANQGLVQLLYLRDPAAAKKTAERGRARGIPESDFGFLYPLMGDLGRYSTLLHQIGDPLADRSVDIFTRRARGDFAGAAAGIEALADKSPYADFLYYVLADTYLQAKDDGHAIDRLMHAQAAFPAVSAPGPGFAGVFRARSDYELGVLYERTGQPAQALASTERFLRAWSKADADLPELRDAQARLSRLRSSGHIELR